ncbi:MAG: SufE family protein [Bacteroidales bacterium]|nr:SufE family protein [Bacteroidales bacterium]
MMSIKEKEEEIIAEFESYPDWMDKYNYLIELGKSLPLIDPALKDDNHVINGCQSKVWLNAEFKEGIVFFQAESEALITRGMVNLLLKVFSGQKPEDILNNKLEFIEKIGLKEHLSPTRANGLLALIKQIRLYAMAFQIKGKE